MVPHGSSSVDYRINPVTPAPLRIRELKPLTYFLIFANPVAQCLNHVLVYIRFLPQNSCRVSEDSGLSYGVDGIERKEELSNLEIWKTTVSQNQV